MRKMFLVGVAFGTLACYHINAQHTWYNFSGHQYALTLTQNTWEFNEAEAVSAGGHLVTINSAAENNWLAEKFDGTYAIGYQGNGWGAIVQIGYSLDSVHNQWEWASGEPVTFTSYYYLWPSGGPHAYLHERSHPVGPYQWNANPAHTELGQTLLSYGVIEIVPEPGQLTLLLLAAATFLVLRPRKARRTFAIVPLLAVLIAGCTTAHQKDITGKPMQERQRKAFAAAKTAQIDVGRFPRPGTIFFSVPTPFEEELRRTLTAAGLTVLKDSADVTYHVMWERNDVRIDGKLSLEAKPALKLPPYMAAFQCKINAVVSDENGPSPLSETISFDVKPFRQLVSQVMVDIYGEATVAQFPANLAKASAEAASKALKTLENIVTEREKLAAKLRGYTVGVTTLQDFWGDDWGAKDFLKGITSFLGFRGPKGGKDGDYFLGYCDGLPTENYDSPSDPTVLKMMREQYDDFLNFPHTSVKINGVDITAFYKRVCMLRFKDGVLAEVVWEQPNK